MIKLKQTYRLNVKCFSVLHLSFLIVHKHPDLIWTEGQVDICGGFRAEGVFAPEDKRTEEKVYYQKNRRKLRI